MADFRGWWGVTGSKFLHLFVEGVSACGRYDEKLIDRGRNRGAGEKRCGNCQRKSKSIA
jgi:hypothetical protein